MMPKSLQQCRNIISQASPYFRRFNSTNRSSNDDGVDADQASAENSAMVERMKQILKEKITANPSNTSQLRQMNPHINSILTKYDYGQKHYDQATAYIKSEPLLAHNKHARDIYNSKPWSGNESNHDANLRMILDSKPKPINDPMATFNKKPKHTVADKLSRARDDSLDYKINKTSEDKERAKFREMYKERLLGPSMLVSPSPSVDFVDSLATSRINAAIDQQTGQFKSPTMSTVRGKPLSPEHLKNCTDTNYFMTQVLNNQEVLPPWIENQQGLNKSIKVFRSDLDQLWFKWILNESVMKHFIERSTTVDQLLDDYEKNIKRITYEDNSLPETDVAYIEANVKLLNAEIRSYNLQCPSVSGHKLKLDVDREINQSYWRTLDKFPTLIKKWFKVHKEGRKSKLVDNPGGGSSKYLDSFKIKGSEIHENRNVDPSLNIWKAVKDIFKMAK